MAMMSRDADLRVTPPEGFSVHVMEGQGALSSKRTEFTLRGGPKLTLPFQIARGMAEVYRGGRHGADGEWSLDRWTLGAPLVRQSPMISASPFARHCSAS